MAIDLEVWKLGANIVEEYVAGVGNEDMQLNKEFAKNVVDAMDPNNKFGHDEASEFLIKQLRKLDEPETRAFINALIDDDPKRVVDIQKESHIKKDYIMLCACTLNCAKIVHLLIANHSNINFCDNIGWTPLTTAIVYDNQSIAEMLIESGADVNYKTQYGSTPLMVGVLANNVQIVKQLIAKGANLNEVFVEDTALSLARKMGNSEIVEALFNAGAI